MASVISAGTTSGTSLNLSGDTSGVLQLASNGSTTAVTIDTSQRAAFVAGTDALPAITTTGDTNTGIFFPAADTFAASTAGSERMRIDSSGNVGVGTTPKAWSTSNSTKALQISSRGSIWANVNSTSINNNWYLASGDVDKYIATAAATRYVQDATGIHQWLYAASGSADATISFTEAMRIDSSGNVVMGHTAWDYSVNGFGFGAGNAYSYFTRTSGFALLINRKTSTGAMQAFNYNNSGVGDISTNGSNCTFNSTSDYRLKQNIQPMTGALARVSKLKPVTYNWIRENQAGEGFIAHELQEVVPEAVTGTKDAVDEEGNPVYQAIDQSVLVATLTAAIQELKAELDATKAEVQALKGVA